MEAAECIGVFMEHCTSSRQNTIRFPFVDGFELGMPYAVGRGVLAWVL